MTLFPGRTEVLAMMQFFLAAWLAVVPIHASSFTAGGQISKDGNTVVDIRGIWQGKTLDEKKARARGLDPGVLEVPKKVRDVPPAYPPQAIANGERGTVTLECRIDIDGIVRDCKVTRKVSKLLDAEALACVAQWRYQPLKLAGEFRAALANLTVQFRLT